MYPTVLLCAFAASALAAPVAAAEYPTKPIRMIVPYAAGGNADIQARYMADQLTDALGRQVVVDNRGGANGQIGMELAARSPADGYTLLLVASGFAVNPALFPKLKYDTVRDFAPITLVGETPQLLVANASVPAGNVKELLALAQQRPGQINYGSSGNGSPAHLAGALLEVMTGAKLVHVPYKATSRAIIDTIGGQIQLALPSLTSVLPHVKSGKLKALAITVRSRSALAPEVPTLSEAGVPGYEASIWNGLLAPAGTPRPVVDKLNRTVVGILKSPEAQARYAQVGAEIRYSTPREFAAFVRSEMEKWAKVIRTANVRVE